MTSIQWVVASGLMVGAGLWALLWRWAPARPDLAQTLALLSPHSSVDRAAPRARGWAAVGAWGLAKLPDRLRPLPVHDLALLAITAAGFMARKLGYALVGLVTPGALGTVLILLGVHLPWAVPAVASLAAAVVGFLLPDLQVRTQAVAARREFSRSLACFVDLVALERSCGSGTKQALDMASTIGDSWVFARLRECLDHANWAGLSSWDALRALADELGLAELSDVADIIRLSGAEGAGIHRILRAKARSLREAILTADLTQANEANERMSVPVSVLGIIFLAILIGPALLSMTGMLL
jgi:hypothetical protein